MDTKTEMKEEESHVASQNERDFFVTMGRNSDDVPIKTEIESETPFTFCPVKQIKSETEIEEQTLVSDFYSQNEGESLSENPVMKDKKYNFDREVEYKIEMKEEPLWLETNVSHDSKDGNFPAVESSRLCMQGASGAGSRISLLSSAEDSGSHKSFCNVNDHVECQHQKSDVTEIPTAEDVLLVQSGKCGVGEMYIRPLYLKQNSLNHEGKKSHRCTTCGKSFTRLSHLKRHNVTHEGKKPHQCKACDKSFTQLGDLKRHNLIHDGKNPHQCKTCSKSFTRLSHLERHYLIHEGKKAHQCKTCDKSFTHLSNLKTHILIHEGRKPHKCKICDKRFTQLSYLKIHHLIHERKKPHHCKTCDKSFTQLSNLKTHNLIHEGKKPHQCKTCDKSFTQLSYLKTHQFIHEGKKPYQCKTCDKRFTQMSHLKRHNFIH